MRLAEGEEQLSVLLLVDGSASMAYPDDAAEMSKWAACVGLACMIAALATRQGDRVGFAIGREGVAELEGRAPSSSRDRLRAIGHALEGGAAGTCPWWSLIESAAAGLPSKAMVVAISDFLDPDPEREDADEALTDALSHLAARGHQVVMLQVLHPDELQFPWSARKLMRFEDPTGRREPIQGPGASLREEYLERLAAHQDDLTRRCEIAGLYLHTVIAEQAELPRGFSSLLARLAGGGPAPDSPVGLDLRS
jgi:uncharacterized protein (DUF58 family)